MSEIQATCFFCVCFLLFHIISIPEASQFGAGHLLQLRSSPQHQRVFLGLAAYCSDGKQTFFEGTIVRKLGETPVFFVVFLLRCLRNPRNRQQKMMVWKNASLFKRACMNDVDPYLQDWGTILGCFLLYFKMINHYIFDSQRLIPKVLISASCTVVVSVYKRCRLSRMKTSRNLWPSSLFASRNLPVQGGPLILLI